MRLTVGIIDIDWRAIMESAKNMGTKSGSLRVLVDISAVATQQIIDAAGQHMDLPAGGTGISFSSVLLH